MKRSHLKMIPAIVILLLLASVNLYDTGHRIVAYAASQAGAAQPIAPGLTVNGKGTASISLSQAPLALQIAVGALVLLFVLMAVIPPFLKERER